MHCGSFGLHEAIFPRRLTVTHCSQTSALSGLLWATGNVRGLPQALQLLRGARQMSSRMSGLR